MERGRREESSTLPSNNRELGAATEENSAQNGTTPAKPDDSTESNIQLKEIEMRMTEENEEEQEVYARAITSSQPAFENGQIETA